MKKHLKDSKSSSKTGRVTADRARNEPFTYLVVTKGEVEADDIHASVNHLLHGDGVVAAGPEGANDCGLALTLINRFEDVLEANAR